MIGTHPLFQYPGCWWWPWQGGVEGERREEEDARVGQVAENIMKCDFRVMFILWNAILRIRKILMVFSGYGDLLMLCDQFSLF